MLDRLLKVEEQLARIEALLLIFFVLLMLGLAVYNVFYRNVLVPIQLSALTEDVPAAGSAPPEPAKVQEEAIPSGEVPSEADGFGGGFGGGFGDDAVDSDSAHGFGGGFGDEPPADAPVDDVDGFGGGFGEPTPDAPEPTEAAPAEPAGGFGGGFGDPDEEAPQDSAEGFGGGFGDDVAAGAPTDAPPALPEAAPRDFVQTEEELPFIARAVDAMKLEWIDVLLRQLVLVVGFLGATLATRRRKHITIDALSKLLGETALARVHILTNIVSFIVCFFLMLAGFDLVAISVEFPRELVSWAYEWQFQLAFPIGFGLLCVHFAIRIVESVYFAMGWAEPDPSVTGGAL